MQPVIAGLRSGPLEPAAARTVWLARGYLAAAEAIDAQPDPLAWRRAS
jgi:hypothetical protein